MGLQVDSIRLRAFPFSDVVNDFIAEHEEVFVIEQNRDGQLRTLIINELGADPARVIPILHYDGTPITARFIAHEIAEMMRALHVDTRKAGKVA